MTQQAQQQQQPQPTAAPAPTPAPTLKGRCIHCGHFAKDHAREGNRCMSNPNAELFDRKLLPTSFESKTMQALRLASKPTVPEVYTAELGADGRVYRLNAGGFRVALIHCYAPGDGDLSFVAQEPVTRMAMSPVPTYEEALLALNVGRSNRAEWELYQVGGPGGGLNWRARKTTEDLSDVSLPYCEDCDDSHPPESCPMNCQRAEGALAALETFARTHGEWPTGKSDLCASPDLLEQNLADLLCNLGHLCDRENLRLAECLRRAQSNYSEETQRQGKQQFSSEVA